MDEPFFIFFLGGGGWGGAIGTTLRLWLRNLARISTKLILRIGVVAATARQPLPSTNSNHNVFSVDVVVLLYRPKHRLGLFLFWFFFFVLASYSAISLIDPVGIISMGFFFIIVRSK